MTCFWDGIMKSLTKSDRELLGLRTANIYTLIERLQHLNCKTTNINCQNIRLSNQQLDENMEHVRIYKKTTARSGYLCSPQDPFLFLLSFLLHRPIKFNYCGNNIHYTHALATGKLLQYKCNRGHFS